MYGELENLIGLTLLLGILSLIASLAIPLIILLFVARALKGRQPPIEPGAQPSGTMPSQMLSALLMMQARYPSGSSAGQPGPRGLSVRQDVINAGIDPTPRP